MKRYANLRMILTILFAAAGMYFSSRSAPAAILCWFIALWLLPLKMSSYVLAFKCIAAILLAVFSARDRLFSDHTGNHLLTVTYIDVGQGDSTLIQLPDQETILIDAGTKEMGTNVIKALNEAGITRIDYLVATHPHADHIGGMPDVIRAVPIGAYIQPDTGTATVPETYSVQLLNNLLKQKHIPLTNAFNGDVIAEGDTWSVRVLSPLPGASFEDLNDYSLIIKVTFGRTSFLFTGDAGYLAELELLDEDLSCDVLKIGHHGSFGSTSTAFLAETDPSIAVISVGKDNDSNLPNSYVLERLREEGIRVLRTDEEGTIRISSDGYHIDVLNDHKEEPE